MVLDDWYFRLGPKTQEEWTAALREVVSPHAERFAAVSVATQSLPATASCCAPPTCATWTRPKPTAGC